MTTTGPIDVLAKLTDPDIARDPFAFLHWLRDHDPVHRTREGTYLLTRYADVKWVLQKTGSVFLGPDRSSLEALYPGALIHRSQELLWNSVTMKNPPEHTRLRKLMSRGFTPKHAARFRELAERIADRFLDSVEEPLRDGEVIDLRSAVSMPIATEIMAELIGVPEPDRQWLAELVTDMTPAAVMLPTEDAAANEAVLARADHQSRRLEEYFLDLFAQRRREPADDLISAYVETHDSDPDALTDEELISMVWVLWIAGVDTSGGSTDQAVWAMLRYPDEARWLERDAAGATAFAEEAIRLYASPLEMCGRRFATQEIELGGKVLPVGADVRLSTAAANRDPEVFADPDRFDPSRDSRQALGFGGGIHYCPGASLGSIETSVVTARLHARFPSLVAAGDPVWQELVAARLFKYFPVALS